MFSKLLVLFILLFPLVGLSQTGEKVGGVFYNQYAQKNPNVITDFAVKGNLDYLNSQKNIKYKYSAAGWHYIRCTSEELKRLCLAGEVTQLYFAPEMPRMLNDTMRLTQNIDSVNLGYAPLIDSFTGRGIIIGYVDTGIDWQHGDFKNTDGTSRVIRYWDHSLGIDPSRTPPKYGYGQVWTNLDIDNGICSSIDNHAHGTTVTGAGSGNANENGHFKGVAPESEIIIVETNFNLANWTLTVADGIDYVFTVADSLGMPAIVNTSVGSYLGSHDGTDPAALVVDSLLKDQNGRIVVASMGNAGSWGKYHLHADVDTDTSFSWFEVNPTSALGTPSVYFDLWADTADFKNIEFAFGADNTIPDYDFRGRTKFFAIDTLLNLTTQDSIMNSGNKLSPVEFYAEEVNGVYHLEVFFENPDSSDYLFRFMTAGSGSYDLWSGVSLNLSNIVNTNLPLIGDFPNIEFYNMPDTLQTMVSSWTCLESVVTVGNFNNLKDYIDMNGNLYTFSHTVGKLSDKSSKGPNRRGYQKPDVVASGDGMLSAVPLYLANNGSNSLAWGGMHVRNGGTSMSSPVIAGIAALYLEKCPNASFEDYINGLHNVANEDDFTGTTPNYGYGYGKVNAFKLLNQTNFDVHIVGDTLICDDPELFQTAENNFAVYNWFNGENTPTISMDETDTVFVEVENDRGCKSLSDSIIVIKGTLPLDPVINILGGGLITTPADYFQWFYDGDTLFGANEQFYDPDSSGVYNVIVYSPEGCYYTSDDISVDLSTLQELNANEFVVFPNPFIDNFQIIKNDYYQVEFIINDIEGKQVYNYTQFDSTDLFISVSIPELASGMYFLTMKYDNSYKTFKLIKQ